MQPLSKNLCRPTVRGEIKKARAGNYNVSSCLFEFIDNSFDAGAQRVRIDLRGKSGSGTPHKFLISDDAPKGIDIDALRSIFSWTFERSRADNEVGEYGAGFKAAAVNLAEKLTVMTIAEGRAFQAVADWQDMADEDRWDPQIMEISPEYFNDVHPFAQGSTFILEVPRNEMFTKAAGGPNGCTQPTTVALLAEKIYDDTAYHYRHVLRENAVLQIYIRGVRARDGGDPGGIDVREHDLLRGMADPFWCPADRLETEDVLRAQIDVYQDQSQFFRVFFQTGKKWEAVEFLDKRKNGNSVLRSYEVSPCLFDGLCKIDSLTFRSVHIRDPQHSSICMGLYPTCSLDLVRRGRVMGRDLSIRAPRAEPLQWFTKHELWFQSYKLNPLLGVQYNKQNAGTMRDNALRHTLEHLQQMHEREFHKIEKIVAAQHREWTPSQSATPTNPDPQDGRDSLVLFDPPRVESTKPETKRKNFSPLTKIQILNRQECRDSVLDFVLKDGILPMDYDHKNGISALNDRENCQALSVVAHAVKTRSPDVFAGIQEDETKKKRFIVDLLNCLTRSRFFVEAWMNGEVQVRDRQQQLFVAQEGLFHFPIPK